MNYRIDWTKIGADYQGTPDGKQRILEAIADIDSQDTGPGEWSRWHEIPQPPASLNLAMMPGLGIKEVIKQLRLPNVSHVGISACLSPIGFYGVRAHYKSGQTVDVFVVDSGDSITLVCARDYEAGE